VQIAAEIGQKDHFRIANVVVMGHLLQVETNDRLEQEPPLCRKQALARVSFCIEPALVSWRTAKVSDI